MSKVIRKVIIMSTMLAVVFGVFLLTGCGNNANGYDKVNCDAVLFYDANDWICNDFVVNSALFEKIYFDPDGGDFRYWIDIRIPTPSASERTFVIKNQEQKDKIISEFSPGVDFAEEMLIVFFFSETYWSLSYRLVNVDRRDNKLSILAYGCLRDRNGAAIPAKRTFIVRMQSLDINEVEFVTTNNLANCPYHKTFFRSKKI